MAGRETVKGTFGNEPIELNNAASEATLTAMLKIAQKDSAVLAAMAKQAGLDAKKIEDALENQQGGDGKGKGMGLLGGAANLAGGFLMDMVGSIGKTIGSLANLSQSLMDGSARASDFFKAFSGLPLGLGLLADALAFSQKFFEKQIDTYRIISQTGAGLSSSLGGLRIQALNLGLSMDEFGAMFAKNQRALGQLGGKSMETAKNLVAINNALVNSQMGRNLAGLGYTFSELNGLIGDYLAVTADGVRINRDAGSEQRRLAKAAGEYGKELDFLARLTGESREAIQKKMEADNQEASWQLYLNTLGPEAQKQATEAIARARLMGGKGGVDAIKSMFMGFAGPFTQEGQFFVSTMHGGTQALKGMVAAVKSGQSSEIVSTQINKLFAQGMSSNIKDVDRFRHTIYAAGQGGAESAKAFLELVEAQKNFRAQGKTQEAEILASIIATQKKAAADSAAAKSQADADKQMKALGATLVTALLPALSKLSSVGLTLIHRFTDFIKSEGVMDKIKKAANILAEFIENLFSEAGREKILNDFKYMLKLMLIEVKYALNLFYTKGDAAAERAELERQKKIIDLTAQKERLANEAKVLQEKMLIVQRNDAKQFDQQIKLREKHISTIENDGKLEEAVKQERIEKIRDEIRDLEDKKEAASRLKAPELAAQIEKNKQDQFKTIEDLGKAMAEQAKVEKARGDRVRDSKETENNMPGPIRPNYASGTLGSGKLIQNFGRETVAALHGREAVLNEEQLTNLAKGVRQSSPQINLDGLDILAEGIITLNRATAIQNKILGTMVENQRTMINRATGNRLMA
jgi:hypothetical protein